MKRTPLLFLFAFILFALAVLPAAKMEVRTTTSPMLKTAAHTVSTAAPFTPPTVTLTSPVNNSSFIAGSTIQLTANASDSDGTIVKVEFFQGATKLGEDATAPYSFDWTNVPDGTYSLTARATDNANEVTTSTAINISVLPQSKQYAGWSYLNNAIDLGNGTVRKTSPSGWEIVAIAAQQLLPGDSYFESTAASSFNQSMLLNAADGQNRYFAIGAGGWAGLYENGVEVASTCCRAPNETIPNHLAGDRYRFEISNGKLLYVRYRAGVRTLLFTSNAALPGYPYTMSLHAFPQNAEWQNTVAAQVSRNASWASIANGIDLGNGSLRKTSTGSWDFSAYARQQLVSGSGYFESTTTSYNQAIQLDAVDGQYRYIMLGTGSWAGIYENGVEVASTCCRAPNETIAPHIPGDRYRLEISRGKLRYVRYRSGVRSVMWTSLNALPTYPFRFRLVASFQNSEWQNSIFNDNVPEHNDAVFVSQTMPTTLSPGQSTSATVTMRNTGASTWTPDGDYQLASENLSDNTTWGLSRVNLTSIVPPGADAVFSFTVTAPTTPGAYSFQWRMVQQNVQRFGALSTNLTVTTANNPPTVTLISPSNNATYNTGSTISLSANASDSDGTISKVEFFQGTTKLGEDTTSPYSFSWTNVATGSYQLTARATDNGGAIATSDPVNITVVSPNQPPSVSLTTPSNNQIFSAPANITLTANATDTDGIVTKVQFFQGTTLLNEDLSEPFSFTWTNVAAGSYSLTAKAFDNAGATTTSAAVAITVNTLPTISITTPTNPTTFATPANINITASASDPDGSISKVEFFSGASLLGEDTTAPYTFAYNNVSSGTYSLTARATDDRGGVMTSSAVSAIVTNTPTTSITSPANNSAFNVGANIIISAFASDSDGSVAKVEFFKNGVLLGEDTTAPYSFTWNNVPAGTYALTSRATDNLGLTGTSAAVGINVSVTGVSRIDPINSSGGTGENPFSRNYNWSVPLVNLPGRAGLNLGLSLSYNSLVWTKDGDFITFDADKGFPSPGFRLGFPVIQGPFLNTPANKDFYLLITPDGSRVELRQIASGLYEAVDSSYLLLNTNTMVLSAYDGTQMSYVLYGSELQCTKIKDRNGNFITINRDGAGRITTIVDTLTRTIQFNYDGGNALTSITQSWTVNGSSVTHTWASFQYRNPDLTINTNFTNVTNVGPQNGSTRKVLSGVTFPDNSRFEFEYTSWGQVWKISQFASDGQTLLNYRSYDLPLDNTNPQSDCPRFTIRHDWAKYWNRNESGTEQEATISFLWQADASWTMPPNNTPESGILAQVNLPDGTYHKSYSHSSGWDKGLPLLTETYDNSQNRQRQVTMAWTQDDTALTVPLNPRVTETNTFDPAGNRKRTRITYQQLTFGPTTCSLPQDVFEYKANASDVLRSTRTTYNVDPPYTSRRIIGLVSQQAVYEGDVTNNVPLASKSTYIYDESGSIQPTDEPVQHDPTYNTSFVAGRGNITSVKRHDINDDSQITITRTKYNTAGAVVSSKDASDHEMTVSYTDAFAANGATLDAPRSFVTLAYPTTINDADGYSTKTRYNYDFGAITWKQTPLPNGTANDPGPEQTFTYDSIPRLERVTSLVNNARVRYLYGPNYVQSWSTVNNVADEALSLQVFDGTGREIATAKNHPGSDNGFSGQIAFYDVMGRTIKQSNPAEMTSPIPQSPAPLNPYAWQATGDDATWIYRQQTYDWKGRPLVTTNQDDTTIINSYAGCGCAGGEVVTVTDEGTIDFTDLVTPRRRQQKFYSDIFGRTVKTEVLSWEGGGVLSATVNTYNVSDQVTQARRFAGAAPSDPNDMSCPSGTCQKTEMTYDGHGRLKTRHTPSQQVDINNPGSTDHVTWDYNPDDTIQKITDPRGTVSTYSYNNRHLVTGITYTVLNNVPITGASGVLPTTAVTFEYDAAGNRTKMIDGLGNVTYNFDQLSRLETETRYFGNLTNSPNGGYYTLTYGYNLANELTSVRDPFNVQVNYSFDTSGRLSTVTGSGFAVSTFISSIEYRAWGAPKSVVHGNNRIGNSTYDARMRIASYELSSVPQDSLKLHNQYEYFKDGRLRKVTDLDDHEPSIIGWPDTARHFSRVYTYDWVGRLLKARGFNTSMGIEMDQPFRQFYGYDSFDNLVSRSGGYYYQSSVSDSGTFVNNRRQGWDYAADGQETHSTGPGMFRDWKYDTSGKMVQVKETVTATNQASTFVTSYDGNGQQIREFIQENQANTDSYIVRSTVLGEVITRLNSTGNKVNTLVHIDKQVTPVKIGSDASGFVGWTHVDPLNLSFGGDTKAVNDPFGNPIAWQPVPTGPNPQTYPRSSASMGSLGSLFGSGQDRDCIYNDLPISCQKLAHYIDLGVVSAVVRGVERPVIPFGLGIYEISVPDKDGKKLGAAEDDEENDIIRVNRDEDDQRSHFEYFFVPLTFPQNPTQKPMDTTQTEKMLTEDCLTFLNSILAQLKDPHSKNLLDILKAAKGRLFTRNLSDEEKKKRLGGTHSRVGDPAFYIYLGEAEYANDPYLLIHELFHGAAGTGNGYTHFDMATAAYKAALADPAFMKYANRHGGLKEPKLPDYSPDSKDPEDWYNADVFDRIARHGCTHPIDWNW